jgi:hypothetical protein
MTKFVDWLVSKGLVSESSPIPLPDLTRAESERLAVGLCEPMEVEGDRIYGVFNLPCRNRVKEGGDTATILRMIQILGELHWWGPFVVLTTFNMAGVLDVERVEDHLVIPDSTHAIAVVQATPDVIRLVKTSNGSLVPQLFKDIHGNCGVAASK